jgi:hypothetical protein
MLTMSVQTLAWQKLTIPILDAGGSYRYWMWKSNKRSFTCQSIMPVSVGRAYTTSPTTWYIDQGLREPSKHLVDQHSKTVVQSCKITQYSGKVNTLVIV